MPKACRPDLQKQYQLEDDEGAVQSQRGEGQQIVAWRKVLDLLLHEYVNLAADEDAERRLR